MEATAAAAAGTAVTSLTGQCMCARCVLDGYVQSLSSVVHSPLFSFTVIVNVVVFYLQCRETTNDQTETLGDRQQTSARAAHNLQALLSLFMELDAKFSQFP